MQNLHKLRIMSRPINNLEILSLKSAMYLQDKSCRSNFDKLLAESALTIETDD